MQNHVFEYQTDGRRGKSEKVFTLDLYNGIVKVHERSSKKDGGEEVNSEGKVWQARTPVQDANLYCATEK